VDQRKTLSSGVNLGTLKVTETRTFETCRSGLPILATAPLLLFLLLTFDWRSESIGSVLQSLGAVFWGNGTSRGSRSRRRRGWTAKVGWCHNTVGCWRTNFGNLDTFSILLDSGTKTEKFLRGVLDDVLLVFGKRRERGRKIHLAHGSRELSLVGFGHRCRGARALC
jgi:hypothetical protein